MRPRAGGASRAGVRQRVGPRAGGGWRRVRIPIRSFRRARCAGRASSRARTGPAAPRRLRAALLSALLLLALPSCGGGSGPTAPPGPPPPPPPGVRFTPLVADPPADSLTLASRSSDTEQITLALVANDVDDLFGYALDLVFDPAILSFASFEAAGGFLDEGQEGSVQVVENPEGRLVIGQTRVGAVPGFSGSGDVLLLTFRAEAAGSSALLLEAGTALDSTGAELETVFIGGTVVVTR